MFRNPSVVLANKIKEKYETVNITHQEAFSNFAFMNFFQRPELKTGKSIVASETDMKNATKIINQVIEIIKPNSVVFLSKKAYITYDKYCDYEFDVSLGIEIDYVMHPTSPHWYTKEEGKRKFERLIAKYID